MYKVNKNMSLEEKLAEARRLLNIADPVDHWNFEPPRPGQLGPALGLGPVPSSPPLRLG